MALDRRSRLVQWMAPVLLVPGILFSQEKNRHSWTLSGGDTVTGTIESAGARGVLVKREDGGGAALVINGVLTVLVIRPTQFIQWQASVYRQGLEQNGG